jgi:linoleoyl-CoA desaturase
MPKVTFTNKDNQFFTSLKAEVDNYFDSKNLSRNGNWKLYIKTATLLASVFSIYYILVQPEISGVLKLALCPIMGFLMASIGFSIMHDANHGAYSSNDKVNDFWGTTLNMLGANAYFWKQKHNIIHHTYTNIDGLDDDIAKSPIIRQCESQKWVPAHKIQYIYMVAVYSLSALFWVYIMDFTKYFGRKIYTTQAWKLSFKNHVAFWATKLFYGFFYIGLPIYLLGVGNWAIGYFLINTCLGLTLALVFQLAHVVENTEFEHVPLDATKHIETAWAIHQIKTTANFARNNQVISWFVGGLNFQIEHHLFPKVSHIHYPAISKIVEAKCKEFNLPYNEYPSFFAALASHFRVMKMLGNKPEEATAPLALAA